MGENACRRGQNQPSSTFYGVSNFRGLGLFGSDNENLLNVTKLENTSDNENLPNATKCR